MKTPLVLYSRLFAGMLIVLALSGWPTLAGAETAIETAEKLAVELHQFGKSLKDGGKTDQAITAALLAMLFREHCNHVKTIEGIFAAVKKLPLKEREMFMDVATEAMTNAVQSGESLTGMFTTLKISSESVYELDLNKRTLESLAQLKAVVCPTSASPAPSSALRGTP